MPPKTYRDDDRIFEEMPFAELRAIVSLRNGERVVTSTGVWTRDGATLVRSEVA